MKSYWGNGGIVPRILDYMEVLWANKNLDSGRILNIPRCTSHNIEVNQYYFVNEHIYEVIR
jgi:hypothetical protein